MPPTEAPQIINKPRDMRVLEDGSVHFFCQASGMPAPTFTWERDGNTIKSRKRNTRFKIIDAPYQSALKISEVRSRRDNTTYTCKATNSLGDAEATAQLFVIPAVAGGRLFTSQEV